MRKLLNITAVIGTLALLAACAPRENPALVSTMEPLSAEVIAEGHVEPKEYLHIAFQTPGRVDKLLVSQGDSVKVGQVLAKLGDRGASEQTSAAAEAEQISAKQEYDRLLRTAPKVNAQAWTAYLEAQIVRAEAEEEWEKLDLDQIDDDIEDAENDVKDYQADLVEAQKDFDKYKDLDKDSSKRKNASDDLETAQEDYNEAVRKLEEIIQKRDLKRSALDDAIHGQAEAKRSVEISSDQPDKDQLEIAEARLELANKQLASAQQNLSYFDLVAPFDGIVTELNISLGEWVTPASWAVGVANTNEWYVETTDLSELDVVDIKTGQTVGITADALPGIPLSGIVERIGLEPVDQGGDIYYTIRIKLIDPDPSLKWGMTVEVKIPAEEAKE